jgi:hypothetical protein
MDQLPQSFPHGLPGNQLGNVTIVSSQKSMRGINEDFNRSAARQSTKNTRLYFRPALSWELSAPKFPISLRR